MDIETGLHYYGARYYDSESIRFLSVDKLADHPNQVDKSPYAYAWNNPVLLTDPDGNCPWCIVWGVVEIGLAIYDVYDTGSTLIDPNASNTQKAVSAGGFLLGALLPGGGYGTAGKKGLNIVDNYADDVVEQVLKHGDDAKKIAKIDMARESGEYMARGSTKTVGENYLKSLGGKSQKYFNTKAGKGGRYVDQFVNGVAHESKTGYTTLTKSIKEQIAKDAELLANPNSGVNKVVWNFFKSPITGKAGASKPLQEALKNAGIETKIIRNID